MREKEKRKSLWNLKYNNFVVMLNSPWSSLDNFKKMAITRIDAEDVKVKKGKSDFSILNKEDKFVVL